MEDSELVDILGAFQIGDCSVKNVKVQVLAINRYLIDGTNRHFAIDVCDNYLYDVIITDGSSYTRALLSPCLNYLVQTNQLKRTSLCLIALEEEQYKAKPCLVIKRLQVFSPTLKPIGALKFYLGAENKDGDSSLESFVLPTTGVRHYYINVWNDVIVEWPLNDADDDPYISSENLSDKVDYLLRRSKNINLLDIEQAGGKPRFAYPLCVRVIGAGKLTHLNKPSDMEKCSFRGTYVVTDGSAVSYMSLWDSPAASLCHKIEINSILLIKKYYTDRYKGKPNTKFANVHKMDDKLTLTTFEIKVNAKKETSCAKDDHNMYVFKPNNEDGLPHLPYAGFIFVNHLSIQQVNNQLMYDVAGIVLSLSRYERIPRFEHGEQVMKGVWVLRWIEVTYWPDAPPYRLQIFVNGQLEVHRKLRVGDRVVACNMRVIMPDEMNESRYFTSTNETQLIILTQENEKQFNAFRELQNLYNLDDPMVQSYMKNGNGIGGMYNYYRLPKNLHDLKVPFYESIDNSNFWSHTIDNMWFWLSKRIIISGLIAQIKYFNMHTLGLENDPSPEIEVYTNHNIPMESLKFCGLVAPHPNTFSHKFQGKICRPLQFPVTTYLTNPPKRDGDEEFFNVKKSDFVCDGYYEVVIVDGENAMRCFFIPKPSDRPFPTIRSLLCQEYTPILQETQYRIRYTSEELDTCLASAKELQDDRRYKFVVELFKHSSDECEAILHCMHEESQVKAEIEVMDIA